MWDSQANIIKDFIDSIPEERKDAVMPTREQYKEYPAFLFT